MKALGVAGPSRSASLPEVPTFAEMGMPEIDYTAWFGVFAPAATRKALVTRIHRDIAAILGDADVRRNELAPKAYEPSTLGPDAFASFGANSTSVRRW